MGQYEKERPPGKDPSAADTRTGTDVAALLLSLINCLPPGKLLYSHLAAAAYLQHGVLQPNSSV